MCRMRLVSVYLAPRTHFSSRQRLVLSSIEDRSGGVLYIATYPPITLREIESNRSDFSIDALDQVS